MALQSTSRKRTGTQLVSPDSKKQKPQKDEKIIEKKARKTNSSKKNLSKEETDQSPLRASQHAAKKRTFDSRGESNVTSDIGNGTGDGRAKAKKRMLDSRGENDFKSETVDGSSEGKAKAKKRTLDTSGENGSKPEARSGTGDGTAKSKKTKHSNVALQPLSKVSAEKEPTSFKELPLKEHDKTALLLKELNIGGEEDMSGGDSDSDSPTALKDIPSIPKIRQIADGEESKDGNSNSDTGVIYVGRIPHGFYEHQMNAYFSQFGEIRRLRISRNRKTGHSKHYAFIEFASPEVASIVAKTMDKYLLFGHILQVRVISSDQVHPELFKGSGKKFRHVPRNKVEGEKLEAGLSREGWEKRIKAEESRRRKKNSRVKKMMDYEYEAPSIKKVAHIPLRIAEKREETDQIPTPVPGGESVLAKSDNVAVAVEAA